jgi:hypothetical protein
LRYLKEGKLVVGKISSYRRRLYNAQAKQINKENTNKG